MAQPASSLESPENPARPVTTSSGRDAATIEPMTSAPAASAPLAQTQESFIPATMDDGQRRAEVTEAHAERIDDGVSTSKRQRVTAAAREVVDEKLSPRVEKLRHASNVMLEEAAYDPSLRFVLVAVAILLISLFLLLLNYLIG